jgi:hypothetical protein
VRPTTFSYDQLVTIQVYSEEAERKFRGMIQRLCEAVEQGA